LNAKDENGQTALHITVMQENEQCMKYLISNNADINAANVDGKTVLHLAALDGSLDCVRCLIVNGGDVNAKDKDKNTPLHFALLNSIEVIELLIRAGADTNIANGAGKIPMQHRLVQRVIQRKPEIFVRKQSPLPNV
jgi:ankyrin repeat protein